MSGDRPERPQPGEEGFLGRWARLKEEARQGEPEAAAPAPVEAEPEIAGDDTEISAEEIEALERIDIESLGYEADFSAFMKKGVPDALRKRALRQLWRSNPVLANVDGLNDYDDDFNVKHTVMETFASAYKVGMGYLTKAEETANRGEDLPEDEAVEGMPDGETPEAARSEDEEATVDAEADDPERA